MSETTTGEAEAPPRRRWAIAGAAAAAVLVGVVGIAVVGSDSDSDGGEGPTASYALPSGLELSSCIALSEDTPPPAEAAAFGGTVTEVGAEDVTVDVDAVYAGPDVDTVTLSLGPDTQFVSLDGVEFVEGERYLVSAVGGEVMICGYSGPATTELSALYDAWFGG